MKRKFKFLFISIILIFLSGCTADYNIDISDNEIQESFSSVVYKSEIPTSNLEGVEADDQLTPFIQNDQYPFLNNYDIIYDKNIVEEDEYRLVKFKYSYSPEDFINSNSLNKCFENINYSYDDNYVFDLNGYFYCLYTEKLNINVTTKNKVISNNADEVNDNTYTWHINSSNFDNVDIRLEIEKNTLKDKVNSYSLIVISIFIICTVLVFFIVLLYKRKKHNKL